MELRRVTPGPSSWSCPQSFVLRFADVCVLLECPLDLHAFLRFLPAYRGPPPPPKLPSLELMQARMGLRAPPLEPPCPPAENGARGKCANQADTESSQLVLVHGESMADMLPVFQIPDIGSVDLREVDVVLVSNARCMLALPYVALHPDFSGKIYATEPTAQMGELWMEELVCLFAEHAQSFSELPLTSDSSCGAPSAVSFLPAPIRDGFCDSGVSPQGNWRSLYSLEEVQACMAKVERIRYGESLSISGCLQISALSSGSDIGSANWSLSSSETKVVYVAASQIHPSAGTALDTQSLLDCEALILADVAPDPRHGFVYPPAMSAPAEDPPPQQGKPHGEATPGALPPRPSAIPTSQPATSITPSEGEGSVAAICGHTVTALLRGGSVLIPTAPSDSMLDLIELLSPHLHTHALSHVPMFVVSPVAHKWLAYANIIPEWLSPQRQEKLYAAEALFGHVELIGKRLFPLPSLHCPEARRVWQEPCVVLASHWSLRMGPAVDLLFKWRADPNSCLIVSQPGLNMPLALAPFQPLTMEVLHVPLSDKLGEQAAAVLLETIQPKHAAVPKHVLEYLACLGSKSTNAVAYVQTTVLPLARVPPRAQMSHVLASQISATPLGVEGIAGTRLQATLVRRDGKWTLEQPSTTSPVVFGKRAPIFVWGHVELGALFQALEQKGFSGIRVLEGAQREGAKRAKGEVCGSSESEDGDREDGVGETVVQISLPKRAVLRLTENATRVEADEPLVREALLEAVLSLLQML